MKLPEDLMSVQDLAITGKAPYFDAFADDFMATYAAANNKPSEVAAKKNILDNHLRDAFGTLRLDEVQSEAIERYKAQKLVTCAPRTVNNHLTCLARMLSLAEEWGYIRKAPKIRKLRVPDDEHDFLTWEHEAKIMTATSDYPWHQMIVTGLRAGLRISEMLALRWSDVDLVTKRVVVRHNVWKGHEGTPKGGKSAEVPLNSTMMLTLKALQLRHPHDLVFCRPDGSPYTRDDSTRPLHAACRAAGIREVGWHTLRHTFGSHLAMRSVPLPTIQKLMRHRSIASTMRYVHLIPDTQVSAIESLCDPPPVTSKKSTG